MKLISIAALSLMLAIGGAMADDAIKGLQNKHDFIATKANISKDLGSDKYKEIKPDDQKKLLATLDRMNTRWEKADDVAQLSPDDRVAMANDQEVVTGILQHAAADSRVVCQRENPIGSNLPTNVCRTVAQMHREQEQAQDAMRAGDKGTN
jgi:hypothetical protein